MIDSKIFLIPLTSEDIEQFILDNQRAFKYGAMIEFGECNQHLDDEEIISRRTILNCVNHPQNETYRIVFDGKIAGGIILKINQETNHNELEILFTMPEIHNKGVGFAAWKAAESLHPETVLWETCTPYFDKRNIHFYVNKCGFQIDQFWCEYFNPECDEYDDDKQSLDEGPIEMLHFKKVMLK